LIWCIVHKTHCSHLHKLPPKFVNYGEGVVLFFIPWYPLDIYPSGIMGGKKQNVTLSSFTLYTRQRTWARVFSKLGSIHSFGLPPLMGPYCDNALALVLCLRLKLQFVIMGVCEAHMMFGVQMMPSS
jgi:hypothetical protein